MTLFDKRYLFQKKTKYDKMYNIYVNGGGYGRENSSRRL